MLTGGRVGDGQCVSHICGSPAVEELEIRATSRQRAYVLLAKNPRSGASIVSNSSSQPSRSLAAIVASLLILASLTAMGCQSDIAGQTLPSPTYLSDDVQYYAPGPEFKLAREAAALKEQAANQISEPQR